jgi:hypothetical protein
MKIKHLHENNETYLSHFKFAVQIGFHLFVRSFVFVFHGIFPFIDVPKCFNLKNTCKLINKYNEYSEARKK